MHGLLSFALVGCALLLVGVVWLAVSVMTLLRSLDDAEDAAAPK